MHNSGKCSPKGEPGGRGVSHDVSSDGLLGVSIEHGGSVHLGNHLKKKLHVLGKKRSSSSNRPTTVRLVEL